MIKQMNKKISNSLRLGFAGLLAVLVILGVAVASDTLIARDAGATTVKPDICSQCDSEHNCALLGCDDEAGEQVVDSRAQNILTALTWFGGVAAVIFIVVGGIQLATSEGDPAKTKKGRSTVLFSVIGLIVALLASFIVGVVEKLFIEQSP